MIVAGGVDADQALSSTELFEYNRPGATWISATNLPGDPFCIKNFIATAALLVCKPFPFQRRIQIWCFFCHKLFLIEQLQIIWYSHILDPPHNLNLLAPTWGSRGALLGGQFLLVGGYAPAAKSYQDSILAWNPVLQVTFILSFVLFSCPSKV